MNKLIALIFPLLLITGCNCSNKEPVTQPINNSEEVNVTSVSVKIHQHEGDVPISVSCRNMKNNKIYSLGSSNPILPFSWISGIVTEGTYVFEYSRNGQIIESQVVEVRGIIQHIEIVF